MEKRTEEQLAREAKEMEERRKIIERLYESDEQKRERARKAIEGIEELIKSGVDENGEVKEILGKVKGNFLVNCNDVEYRISIHGTYRGVSLLYENYMGEYDYEIETTRRIIIVTSSFSGEILAMKRITDKETTKALTAMDKM